MTRLTTVILGLIVSLCMTGNVQGQVKNVLVAHLKKPNPNELYVSYWQGDDCEDSYEQIVYNELTQSRIKRLEEWDYDVLYMDVDVHCMKLPKRPNQLVFSIDMHFAVDAREPVAKPGTFVVSLLYRPDYGNFGITTNDYEGQTLLRNILRECVEKALVDYMKANFDL